MEKIAWDRHEFLPSLPRYKLRLLISASDPPSACSEQQEIGNCCHPVSHNAVDVEEVQQEQDFVHMHEGRRTSVT